MEESPLLCSRSLINTQPLYIIISVRTIVVVVVVVVNVLCIVKYDYTSGVVVVV